MRITTGKAVLCFFICTLVTLSPFPAFAANKLPIANAGPDRTGSVNVALTFIGSGSSDPDGSITTYWWQFGDGGSATVSVSSVSHTYTVAGTYTVTLWVRDNAGAWSANADMAQVVISGGTATTTTTTKPPTTSTSTSRPTTSSTSTSRPTTTSTSRPTTTSTTVPNQVPHASAGPDQFTQTQTSILVDGRGSTDPDGYIVSYLWNFGDGGVSVSGSQMLHVYSTAGVYTVTLTVTDNKGAIGRDTLSVSVANRPPVANAGPDKTGVPGTAVSFSGSGSSDPDGTITSYAWAFGDGAGATGIAPSHAYAAVGTYTATLTVTDNNGARSTDTAAVTISAATGATTWGRAIGGAGNDAATAVAVDANGYTVVGGVYRGPMTVGTTSLPYAGNADMFLVKYSPSGSVSWARGVGGAGDESIQGVAIDPTTGDVVVAGWFTGTANFGGTSLQANGPQDMVLAKYRGSDGTLLWAKRFGGIYEDAADAVAVDRSGNIVLTGYFKNTISFGGATLQTPQILDTDVFLAKFTSAGAHLWSKNFYNTAGEEGTSVAFDANGNIALAGWFTGTFNLGGTQLFAASGLPDGFVARFDANGTHTWSRKLGGGTPEDYDFAYGVAMDGSGNVLVTGAIGGVVNLGGGNLSILGGADAFIAKYSATTGGHVWSRRLGGAGGDYGYGVAVDASSNVIVTGAFTGTASFGGASLTAMGSGTNAFVAKYNSGGAALWARQFGGSSDDSGRGVAAAPTGHPVVAGIFHGSASVDGTALTSVGLGDGVVDHGAP